MSKVSSKLVKKTRDHVDSSNGCRTEFGTQLCQLLKNCVISGNELRKIVPHIERLVQDDVISLDEAREVENLVVEGKVSAAIALQHLSYIENVRSKTACERSRYGTLCILGDPVAGSGHICRSLQV